MLIKMPELPKVSDLKIPAMLQIPQVKLTVFGGSLRTGAYIVAAISSVFGVAGIYNYYLEFNKILDNFEVITNIDNMIGNYRFCETGEDAKILFHKQWDQLLKCAFYAAIATFWISLCGILVAGIHKEKPRLMVFWLCASALGLIYLLYLTIYRSFFLTGIDKTAFQMICFDVIWFYGFDIVYSYYKQIKNNTNMKTNLSHQVLTNENITNDSLIKPTDSCIA